MTAAALTDVVVGVVADITLEDDNLEAAIMGQHHVVVAAVLEVVRATTDGANLGLTAAPPPTQTLCIALPTEDMDEGKSRGLPQTEWPALAPAPAPTPCTWPRQQRPRQRSQAKAHKRQQRVAVVVAAMARTTLGPPNPLQGDPLSV